MADCLAHHPAHQDGDDADFGVEHDGHQRVEQAAAQRRAPAVERGAHQRERRRRLLAALDALRAQRAHHVALGVE